MQQVMTNLGRNERHGSGLKGLLKFLVGHPLSCYGPRAGFLQSLQRKKGGDGGFRPALACISICTQGATPVSVFVCIYQTLRINKKSHAPFTLLLALSYVLI